MMCQTKSSSQTNVDSFISKLPAPTTTEEFNALVTDQSADFTNQDFKVPTSSPLREFQKGAGYQPLELLRGFAEIDGVKVSKFENRLNFVQPGFFGECNDMSTISFMHPFGIQTCGFAKQAITQEFCDSLSIANVLGMQIYPKGDPADAAIAVTLGKVQKYEFSGKYSLDATATAETLKDVKPTFSAGSCDNFALEVHLKIQFAPIADSTTGGFEITQAVADVVYGKVTAASAQDQLQLQRKTSLSWFENEHSRQNSGAPGYVKGSILKTGTLYTPPPANSGDEAEKPYIQEPIGGFPMLGADNTGKCLFIKEALIDPKTKIDTADMESIKDLKYFEDESLSFDDSLLTGCHIDLNYQEL